MNPDVDLEEFARLTEGMVGSHIAFICKRATMLAIAEIIHSGSPKTSGKLLVSATHFRNALQELQETQAFRSRNGCVSGEEAKKRNGRSRRVS